MKRFLAALLLCTIVVICLGGCGHHPKTPPTELQVNDGGLIDALCDYLSSYNSHIDPVYFSMERKIENIKNGDMPLYLAFNSQNSYFVCGYYNSTHNEYGYCCRKDYTWVRYENAGDIQEYYNDIKIAVAFQVNEAVSVTDIMNSEADVPSVENFQLYTPEFLGALTKTPISSLTRGLYT